MPMMKHAFCRSIKAVGAVTCQLKPQGQLRVGLPPSATPARARIERSNCMMGDDEKKQAGCKVQKKYANKEKIYG